MRAPRAVAASMVEAMDKAMREVWEAEPKEKRDDGLKRLVFAHVCNSYARRGGYIKRNG
jgi:hypothetical protein|tara:strand:- start:21 stop:197 length:177 start_codon:yes stop_codon:yes gene_type:complete